MGALVAFLSAQEKLYDPWKELIEFYQAYQTASVTYSRTMEYFNVAPEHQLVAKDRQPYELEGRIEPGDPQAAVRGKDQSPQLVEGSVRRVQDVILHLALRAHFVRLPSPQTKKWAR